MRLEEEPKDLRCLETFEELCPDNIHYHRQAKPALMIKPVILLLLSCPQGEHLCQRGSPFRFEVANQWEGPPTTAGRREGHRQPTQAVAPCKWQDRANTRNARAPPNCNLKKNGFSLREQLGIHLTNTKEQEKKKIRREFRPMPV